MAKKLALKRTAKAPIRRKTPQPKLVVLVDYPIEAALVRPGHYAVRVDALGADDVELRLDATSWLPCREAVGFFWYDWSPQKPGPVVLRARARRAQGRWLLSPERRCFVEA